MARAFFVLLGLLGVWGVQGALVEAQQKPVIKQGIISRTDATNPKEMFDTYCATCHGTSGKGDGPAAAALKKAPADLTKISARSGGKFPTVQVNRFIRGVDEFPAHGSRDMPIWGNLFKALDANSEASALVRVNGLTDYLRSIQQ
jgi:mono/diheme cytochrome c family protein